MNHAITDTSIRQAADLYRAGFSVRQVSRLLYISPTAVRVRLQRAGIKRKRARA